MDRKTILALRPQPVRFLMPEWGGELLALGLTAREADEFTRVALGSIDDMQEGARARAKACWVVRCVRRPDGSELFVEADVDALLDQPQELLSVAFDAVARANGLGREAAVLEKNSPPAGGGGSPSGSP